MSNIDHWKATWEKLEAAGNLAAPVLVDGPDGAQAIVGGLSKREYYAAMAMHGMLANAETVEGAAKMSGEFTVQKLISAVAVSYADALVAELEGKPSDLKGLGSFAKGPAKP